MVRAQQILISYVCLASDLFWIQSTIAISGTRQGKQDKDNVPLFDAAYSKLEQHYKQATSSPQLDRQLDLLKAFKSQIVRQ
jgi:hypothetical protein